MNRRTLLKSLVSGAAISAVPMSASASVRKYGFIDVDGHRGHMVATGENLKVYLDGVEVTSCYEADDVNGYVKLFCRDEQEHARLDAKGALHIDGSGRACRLFVRGNVVMVPEAR